MRSRLERIHGGKSAIRRVPVSRLALVAAAFALAACGNDSPTAPTQSTVALVSAGVAQAAAAVTGQPAPIADAVTGGKVMGFDTFAYPGDATMRAWMKTPGAPYKWVGFYLPSPCHKDDSWTGKRAVLDSMGWGFAVVYVGQQTWGKN